MNRFEEAYRGTPPWDIGRAQPAVERLARAGALAGSVLDAGCGTGENALFLAALGAEVVGLDQVPAAVERAREKARRRGITATFVVGDALRLESLGRTFDEVLDCGLFHTLAEEERPRYVESLAAVTRPGAALHLMCFSEEETGPGPRRVTQAEILSAFRGGWAVRSIERERFESSLHPGGARAWLARIERLRG